MPVTPLHFPLAFAISRVDRRLSLPGLIAGSFMPDIEVPFMWLLFTGVFPDHFILHSILGAVTIGTALSVVAVRVTYVPLATHIFKVDRASLESRCALSRSLVVSCFLGVLSHLLLDYPMHWYNPLLWPWVNPYSIVGPLVLLFAPWGPISETPYFIANLLTEVFMLLWWLALLIRYRGKKLWQTLLVGEEQVQIKG